MIGYGNSYFINTIFDSSGSSGNPPVNTVAPVISGSTTLGSVLSSTTGTWTGTSPITYSYQWKRNGNDIVGANSNLYTIQVADSGAALTCQVTAANIVGSSSATSNTITANTFVAPINTVAPAITGTAQEGQTLTTSTGFWTGTPVITYTYQWKRNGSNIGSATNSTYTLVTADVGQNILCTVTATNAVGSASADSNTVVPVSAFNYLLDTYSGAAAAYSLRKLRSAYSGNCIRVRRSSDNTEQDFGFVNNVLDTASLLTFCGAGNGFVTTWYDQSGNTKNTTQSTAANQPRIVNAGSIDLVNSKPAILGDGIDDTLLNSTLSLTNPTSIFTVVDKVGTSGAFGLWGAASAGSFNVLSGGYDFYQNGPSFSASYSNNNQSLLVAKSATTGTDWELYGNNTTVTNSGQNIGTSIGNIVSLFDRNGGSYRCNMYMQEYIVWNSNQMTNRAGIQTQINTFYNIY